jgi:hypothetical protein
VDDWIDQIDQLPSRVKNEIEYLGKEELEFRYRPEGWTIRQVIHHLADSHMNSFMRFKLTLTESSPTIKPYFENLWAELPDAKDTPVTCSISIIEGLHKRWVYLLKSLNDDQFNLEFIHPEYNKTYKLFVATALYAWHCNHHLGHIKQAKSRKEK